MSETENFRRMTDIVFSLDGDLHVTDTNRSFLQLLNVTDGNICLKDFMDAADVETLTCFLRNYAPKNKNQHCIVTLQVGKKALSCLLHVKGKKKEIYTIDLQELHLSQEKMEKTILQNREYATLLGQFNSYFILHNGKKYSLCSTKDLSPIYRGNKEDFMLYFADFFEINTEIDTSKYQFDMLFNDIEQGLAGKNYRLLILDNSHLMVRTMRSNARKSFSVLALITHRRDLLTDNTYSEKRDGLTELYNKVTITDLAKKKIDVAKQPVSLFIIDVDKFKEFNDNFGHAYGDKVLVTVSKVIEDSVGEQGFAGRIGGDEFLCVLDKTEEEDVRNVARNIKMGVQWSIQAINPDQVVTCSIGISRAPNNGNTYDELFRLADKALYIAKRRGRNCYIVYKPEIHDRVLAVQEESERSTASGKYYMEGALAEIGIMQELRHKEDPNYIEKTLYMLMEYIIVHKICVYAWDDEKKQFEKKYLLGTDTKDIRLSHLNAEKENYFKYMNAYGFLHLDNVNNLDTMDKDRFHMYQVNNVASTLEVLCQSNDGAHKVLVCFDIYKPARTFQANKIVFTIMASKLISHELCSTIQA